MYFFSGDLSQLCGDDCPLECDSVTYLAVPSSVIYPSDMFAAQLKRNSDVQEKFNGRTNITTEELRSNLLVINVFYSSLSYQSFTESPKTQVVDLVSNIGGILGLFLGLSFISFADFFDCVFYLLMAFLSRHANSSSPSPNLVTIDTNEVVNEPKLNKSQPNDDLKEDANHFENIA